MDRPPALFVRAATVLVLAASLVLMMASPATAHTGFESSMPADGESVDGAISEISLSFTGEATPAGEGFVVLDVDGRVRIPDEILSDDDLTWTLRFEEPLADGIVGVRWRVAAPDTHPIEGSFSFTAGSASFVEESPVTTAPPASEAVAPDVDARIEPPVPAELTESTIELDDFLKTGDETAVGLARVGDLGRILGLLGFVLAFGGVAFAALTLRGDQRDIRAVLFWVRRAGVVVVIGAAVTGLAQVAKLGSGWAALWSLSAVTDALVSSFGLAVMLRLAGGLLIVSGAKLHMHSASVARDPVASIRQRELVGVGGAMPTGRHDLRLDEESIGHRNDDAWHIAKSPAAFIGAALLAISFIFDGHTVSEGPRWVHAVANSVHVMTAATWAGGVVMLAIVIARRRRRNVDPQAFQLAVRFSVVATVALVGAGIAGIALTVVILDSISEIWTTPWGLLLIAKAVLVTAAALGGGYNHRIMVPALERDAFDTGVAKRFRMVITFEAVALVGATIVTALLIAASAS